MYVLGLLSSFWIPTYSNFLHILFILFKYSPKLSIVFKQAAVNDVEELDDDVYNLANETEVLGAFQNVSVVGGCSMSDVVLEATSSRPRRTGVRRKLLDDYVDLDSDDQPLSKRYDKSKAAWSVCAVPVCCWMVVWFYVYCVRCGRWNKLIWAMYWFNRLFVCVLFIIYCWLYVMEYVIFWTMDL